MRMTTSKRRHSHVSRLLEQVFVTAKIDEAALAGALSISPTQIEACRQGTERMPIVLQLRFAEWVLARYPSCARFAHRVTAQAKAEAAFHAKETGTHTVAPPSRFAP
jgi:hypothetical protein